MKGKRILVCCNRTLNLGGIEKALTTFLSAFDTKENEVVLVVHDSKGVLYPELPLDNIQVIYTNDINPIKLIKDDITHFRVIEIVKGVWNRIMLRADRDWYARIMYTYRIIKRGIVIPGHFDCAISYSTDYSDMSMVLAADADKRVAFIHGDATKGKRAARLNDHLVCQMDRIYSVSERAKDLFLEMHPACKGSVDVMYNVILPDEIRSKAEEPAEEILNDGKITLCTVGRLSPEKGQQMIPEIAQMMRDSGWDFRWYLVGDGGLRGQLEQEIAKRDLQAYVILLGSKVNPYPYMKKCDIYVQTSYSEAYCITTAEAKVLCKPVVTTNAPGLREQFISGENGLIVDAMTPEALYKGIRTLMASTELREMYTQKLQRLPTRDENDLLKLYRFIME